MVKQPTTPLPISLVQIPSGNRGSRQRDPRVFNNRTNKDPSDRSTPSFSLIQKSTHLGRASVNSQGQGRAVSQSLKPRPSIKPPVDKGRGTKLTHLSDSNRRKTHTPALLQRSKKCKHDVPIKRPASPTPPEDCINHLPPGVPFPKKPAGCEIIPQTIGPKPDDRSTVYFTRNGVLGMPLRYMHNLDGMDNGDEPVNLGLDPMKSCHITLVIAWPGYKEATYQIIAYTPIYPTAPFVTVYGLRQLTKRELAIETLRCIHRWMIEHPWNGERHGGIPDWKLNGENSVGVSAKTVWLSMISPVGDGRWVTQLQKAPGV